jgi:hypothetical protein
LAGFQRRALEPVEGILRQDALLTHALHFEEFPIDLLTEVSQMVTVQALLDVGTDFVLVLFVVISYALVDDAGAQETIATRGALARRT